MENTKNRQGNQTDKTEPQLLEMKGMTKRFGGLTAVDKVDFEIDKGEVLGLVGENAAGKSTLIKMLTGAYKITSGKIYWKGKDVTDKINGNRDGAKELGISVVYQSGALVETMNVYENLFLGQELKRKFLGIPFLNKSKMKSEARRFIEEKVGISIDDYDEEVQNLSGGQQQAVAIGRALYKENAELLVLDEPTANLDADGVSKVFDIIKSLKENKIAVIFIEHNLEHVFKVTDRIQIMRNARRVDSKKTTDCTKEEVVQKMITAS